MLDGGNPRADGVLDPLWRVRVGFDAQTKVARFVHCGPQLFECELDRFRIASMGEHRACGKNLDVIGATVGKLADFLTDFPGTVGFAEVKIPRELNVRRETGHGARTLADRDISAGHEHAWADHDTLGDRVAQGNIVESAIDADVAHGRETGKKCDARVGNGGVSTFGRGFLQHKERFGVAQVGKVRVAIDQSRQNSHF